MQNDPVVRLERPIDVPGPLACATANHLGQPHECIERVLVFFWSVGRIYKVRGDSDGQGEPNEVAKPRI